MTRSNVGEAKRSRRKASIAIRLTPVPWAQRVWALPFLTVLAPSERYYHNQGRQHKKLTEWALWMLLQVRKWLPDRYLMVVADASFAAIELLAGLSQRRDPIHAIVRFRLDAALYEPAPEPVPGKRGRPRKKGKRLPTLEQLAQNPNTRWQKVTVPNWYGEGPKTVEIVSGTAVWYHSGMPARTAHTLGFDPGPQRQVQNPGSALHGSVACSRTDPQMVHPALACGSHFSGSAYSPGC